MDELAHLRRRISDIELPYPVLIAAGVFKTAEQMLRVAPVDVVIPVWGSLTTGGGPGLGGQVYHEECVEVENTRVLVNTQNCLGLPNPGIEHAERHAKEVKQVYADHGKPLAVSTSGNGLLDSADLLERSLCLGADIAVVNGACPHKTDKENRLIPMLCYDTEALDAFFEYIDKRIGKTGRVVLFKISAGMPRHLLLHIKKKIIESKTFMGVVCGNTYPNTLNFTAEGRTTIRTENGLIRGGMAGPAILPISVDQTQFMAEGMPEEKFVVGCGGIYTARDAMKFFHARAKLVKLNSAFRFNHEDPKFMTHLIQKLGELLPRK